MKGKFLMAGSNQVFAEPNIYADKSSLVLEWLLLEAVEREQFSVREVVNATGVSLGQVQKVFGVLVMNGFIQTIGLRTAKKFTLKKPQLLLKAWLEHYSIVKKCKVHTYRTALQGRQQLLETLSASNLKQNVVLALHSAAEVTGFKNTNLETLELYMLEPKKRKQLEEALQLEPQERGFEVLLIEPYYKSMVKQSLNDTKQKKRKNSLITYTPVLLTFLDLYHFPLRGIEQAEFMAERITDLKRIYKKER